MTVVDIVGIVLAGGASSRFGADKMSALFDGAPLLHHALEAVAGVADDIVLVLAPDGVPPALPPALVARIRVAHDREVYGGPLAGLAAGLALVRDEPWRIALVVGGDMPWLRPPVLRLLAQTLAADPSLVAMTLATSAPAPLPMALRPEPARQTVAECLAGGRRSLRALLGAVPSAVLPIATWRAIDPAGDTLRDVDSPGDLDGR